MTPVESYLLLVAGLALALAVLAWLHTVRVENRLEDAILGANNARSAMHRRHTAELDAMHLEIALLRARVTKKRLRLPEEVRQANTLM